MRIVLAPLVRSARVIAAEFDRLVWYFKDVLR